MRQDSGSEKISTPTIVKTSTPPQRRRNYQLVAKMLYFIGLGLADEKDITVKGLEIVQKAERVYLEAYTAVLLVEKEKLVITPPNRNAQSTLRIVETRIWLPISKQLIIKQ